MKKKQKKTKSRMTKDLYLDRETSHGGWPEGPSRGAYDKRPVNVIIADYLTKMGLLDDNERARLSESQLRSLVRKILVQEHMY